MHIYRALGALRDWCFNTMASVATVLSTYPSVSVCFQVKAWQCTYASVNLFMYYQSDPHKEIQLNLNEIEKLL